MEDKTDISHDNFTPSNRTSFRIEDILYRTKASEDFKHAEKSFQAPMKSIDTSSKPYHINKQDNRNKTFPGGYYTSGVPQSMGGTSGYQAGDGGYIQVAVGALGAYFGAPYKSISDPYFLTQGKIK